MKKYGFKKPVIDKTHYFQGDGNVPRVVLQEDGNWEQFLPDPEEQNRRGIETYDCTGFAILNGIETLFLRLYGIKINYSDRWVGIIAETVEGGNDPHIVCEAIRKYGLIPEEMLPFSDDIQDIKEYYSFKGANIGDCYAEGRKWLSQYEFLHTWIFNENAPLDEKINNMKIAYRYSPLPLAVSAWSKNNEGLYFRFGDDNHLTMSYKMNNAFDSYPEFKKELTNEFNYYFVKRLYISKRTIPIIPSIKDNWLIDVLNRLWLFIKDILKTHAILSPKISVY